MSAEKFSDFQRDALQELGNIGAGSAATALSQLLGRDVDLNVPEVQIVPVDKITERLSTRNQIVAAVYLRVFGDIKARTLIIFPQDKIMLLLDLLMKRELGATKELGETEQSALKEVGNIIISAYLNAIAKFIGLNSVPSVPALAVDMLEAIFETVSTEMAEMGADALLIENVMTEKLTKVTSTLVLIPDKDAMEKILKALNDTIKGA